MKKFLSLLGVSALFAAAFPVMALAGECYSHTSEVYSGTGTIKSGVFVRDKACMEGSKVLATFTGGTTVQVHGHNDGWYQISANGVRGWIYGTFLTTSARQTGPTLSYWEYDEQYPSRTGLMGNPVPNPTTNAEPLYQGEIGPRDLIKLACLANAGANDPCKAVYYIGADGKRHAFPNSRVFFTWYSGFDDVRVVSAAKMGEYMLGANATYRPGMRMVKFTTDPKVYVVARGGILRWITSEALARAYYGSNWNKNIDDIPDAFYTNYTFGPDVEEEADFQPSSEMEASTTLD